MSNIHLNNAHAFALYRLPYASAVEAVIHTESNAKEISVNEIDTIEGFVFAPFFNQHKAFLLQGEYYASIELNELSLSIGNQKFKNNKEITFETYAKAFSAYLKAFSSTFTKAILSRPIHVNIHPNVDVLALFSALENKHPEAFVYLLFDEKFGLWLGATPEVLVKETPQYYETVALAGTQKKANNIVWQAKEKEEQHIVERYIEQGLNNKEILFAKSSVETIFSGEVAHLKTSFIVDKSTSFAQLVDVLHPTPAVCGMPKDKALDMIKIHENYDRSLYTGFIGPCFEQKHLFVNLRCMQLHQNAAKIYVGGGITKDSELEQEWEETELKSKTMLSVLEKYRTLPA